MAGEIEHSSDCAVHNEPAFPAGPCDCRPGKLAREIEHQRGIYREGTPETALRRAAITKLMETGEW